MAETTRKRKPHFKSRRGCLPCKAGHYKCDEKQPRCSRCLKYDLNCGWPDPKQPRRTTRTTATTPDIAIPSARNEYEQPVNVVDLELLTNFTMNMTYNLFAQDDAQPELVQKYMQLAFSRHYLLHAIMAVSGMHIYHNDNSRGEVLTRASYLQSQALNEVTPRMQYLAEDESIPVLFFSGLTAIYSLVEGSKECREGGSSIIDPISKMLDCFRLVRGIQTVLTPHWQYVLSSWAGEIFRANMTSGSTSENLPAAATPEQTMLRSLAFGLESAEQRRSCLKSIDSLFRYIQILRHEEFSHNTQLSTRLVQSWIIDVDPIVEDLIREQKPVALIMLAYYAVLMHLGHGTWWVAQWPNILLDFVNTTLGEEFADFLREPNEILKRSYNDCV